MLGLEGSKGQGYFGVVPDACKAGGGGGAGLYVTCMCLLVVLDLAVPSALLLVYLRTGFSAALSF